MAGIKVRARFQVDASPEDVRRWLDDTTGIAGWWSDTVTGSASAVGDAFEVSFPTARAPFGLRVTEHADDAVEWHVPETPEWWKGTSIRFELSPGEGGGTSLLFTHGPFEPDSPVIEIVTPAWVRFLDNLAEVARTGVAAPATVN